MLTAIKNRLGRVNRTTLKPVTDPASVETHASDGEVISGPPGRRRSRKRLTLLAVGMWVAYALIESWIMRTVSLMPWVWSASGFIMMLAMKAALDRAPRLTSLRLLLFIALPLAAAALQSMIDISLSNTIGLWAMGDLPGAPPGFQIDPRGVEGQIVFKINLRTYLWLFGFYAAVMAMTEANEREYRANEAELTARVAAQRAELTALQLQVNPHHLFNALNSLTALIAAGRVREAESFAVGLGHHYRSSFVTADGATAPLSEEVEEVQIYAELLSYRVPGLRLDVSVTEEAESLKVPARLLLPLVENAVKYGAVGLADPVIGLRASREHDDLHIVIDNPISPSPDEAGTGTGLSTARRRLAAAFGRDAALTSAREGDRWLTRLRIPAC